MKSNVIWVSLGLPKIVSEYGQEIPQSQTADKQWHREAGLKGNLTLI